MTRSFDSPRGAFGYCPAALTPSAWDSRVRRLWVAVLVKMDLRWSWTVCSEGTSDGRLRWWRRLRRGG